MLGRASQAVQCLKAKVSFYIELGYGYCGTALTIPDILPL